MIARWRLNEVIKYFIIKEETHKYIVKIYLSLKIVYTYIIKYIFKSIEKQKTKLEQAEILRKEVIV